MVSLGQRRGSRRPRASQAGVTDGAAEKHVPFVTRRGNTVTVRVGEVAHRIEGTIESHRSCFTKNGAQLHSKAGQEPVATFTLEEGGQRLMSTATFTLAGRFPLVY